MDDVGDLIGVGHQVGVFGAVHGQPCGVGLLESVAAYGTCWYLASDGDQGSRVHLGVLEGSDQVGGSGPRGGHRHAHLAGSHCVALGHVTGALFVPGQHMPDWTVEHWVVGGEDRSSGHAEHQLDAFVLEAGKE